MEQRGRNIFSERAMFYGTIFGIIMIFANIFYAIGLRWPPASHMFLLLLVASPFIAGYITIQFREKECNGHLSFSNAWFFLITMYICSAILTAIAQLIYFTFIDNGFLVETMQQLYTEALQLEGIDPAFAEQLKAMSEMIASLTPRDIVINILTTNILVSPIITIIIALFVKKR